MNDFRYVNLSSKELKEINGGIAPLVIYAGASFVSGFGFGVTVGLNRVNRKK